MGIALVMHHYAVAAHVNPTFRCSGSRRSGTSSPVACVCQRMFHTQGDTEFVLWCWYSLMCSLVPAWNLLSAELAELCCMQTAGLTRVSTSPVSRLLHIASMVESGVHWIWLNAFLRLPVAMAMLPCGVGYCQGLHSEHASG